MKIIFTFLVLFTFITDSWAQQKIASEVKGSVSNTELSQQYSISKVYPNPVKDFVNIDIKASRNETFRVSLFNILGVEVKVWDSIFIPAGGQIINFDLSNYKSGVYILKFNNGNCVISQVIRKL